MDYNPQKRDWKEGFFLRRSGRKIGKIFIFVAVKNGE